MEVTWADHKRHRDAVVRDEGQWVGLFDERAEHIMVLPPLLSMDAPETTNVPVSFRATVVVRTPGGEIDPLVEELFANGISSARADNEGRMELSLRATRFVVVARPGILRAYRITHVVVSGDGNVPPGQMEIHGTDMLMELNRHIAWTAPTTVSGKYTRFTRDWNGPENIGMLFTRPRELQDVKMVTTADGVTLGDGKGAEETIRYAITRSLETGWKAAGVPEVIADPPIVVDPNGSGLRSPEVLVRMTDEKLLDTLAPVAARAGVRISARLWLPGAPAVKGLTLSGPKIVVRVEQMQEVK